MAAWREIIKQLLLQRQDIMALGRTILQMRLDGMPQLGVGQVDVQQLDAGQLAHELMWHGLVVLSTFTKDTLQQRIAWMGGLNWHQHAMNGEPSMVLFSAKATKM